MSDLQVVLGFDMETDIGSWTPFYEGLQHGTPVILEILNRNGVTGTFFFTGDSVNIAKTIAKPSQANHAFRSARRARSMTTRISAAASQRLHGKTTATTEK